MYQFRLMGNNVYVTQALKMLGLRNLISATKKVVLPGGKLDDGDWIKMTSEDWDAVGSTNWEDWDATADS